MDQAPPESVEALSARIVDLCGRIHGAEFQLLDLIHRLDTLKPWTDAMPSCAHWLMWRCGLDIVTAREKVRVAHALAELPRVREKFRSGELSYSKVRAITRIAEPSTEAEWVDAALGHTAAQLERIVRQHRQTHCLGAPGAALEAWKHRHFDYHLLPDGSLVFEGRVPAEVGAMLLQAMDRALEWLDAEARAESDSAESHCHENGEGCGCNDSAESSRPPPAVTAADPGDMTAVRAPAAATDRPSHGARRADALGLLAERFLAVAPEQGPVLANDTVRRIGCDAALVRVIESGDGEPLDVGRKTRVIPPAIRRALKRRDGGCRFPGCTHTRFVDGHHIEHWADGGETRLDNLVTVCRHHHRLLHEGGYSVVKRDAGFVFFRADGVQVPEVNDRLQPGELEAGFGENVTALWRGGDRGVAGAGKPSVWRLARGRGFNRARSDRRAKWEAFASARQR